MADSIDPLRRLRADSDRDRFEAAIRRVMVAAEPELARRRREPVLLAIGGWYRPTLIAAAVLLGLSVGVLVRSTRRQAPASTGAFGELVGVPAALASWVDDGTAPGVASLAVLSWSE